MLFLVAFILLAGLLAGCGGGDQSGDGSQDGESGGAQKQGGAEQEGGEAPKKAASAPKIVLGTIKFVNAEKGRVGLEPSTDVQGEEAITLKIKKNTTITLDNEQADPTDIKKGQQAQITYVVKSERNLARKVSLISGD